MWSGPDAVNIVNIDINHYSLLMNRNMELAVSFNPVQSAFNILSSVPNDYGHYDISGYDHNIGDDYYFNRDTIASFVVVPNPGFVFSHWVGTGAAFVIQDTPVNFHLVMNTSFVLRAIFNQNS